MSTYFNDDLEIVKQATIRCHVCGDFGSKDETIAFQSKLDWKWA